MHLKKIAVVASLLFATQVQAQVATGGTLLVVPATGTVSHVNDEVTLIFTAEETAGTKAAAASAANRKMKEGAALVRVQDGSAKLETQNYQTFAVYKRGKFSESEERVIVGWRAVQSLEVTTGNLAGLPKMVAALQDSLALTQTNFHLSEQVRKELDDQRLIATYKNLNARIATIAGAMGRKVADGVLETVEFLPNNGSAIPADGYMVDKSFHFGRSDPVKEPGFEPGSTTLHLHAVGKVKFK